jgi:nicotinamide-nucleotide amidase
LEDYCLNNDLMIATAESCTGGLIAKTLTDRAGSSGWFDSGFVTYSNQAKQHMLGVDAKTLENHGAVSKPVVEQMMDGAISSSQATLAIAVSGVAGPGGGSADKPVGFVWIGVKRLNGRSICQSFQFAGDRDSVRNQTLESAVELLIKLLAI